MATWGSETVGMQHLLDLRNSLLVKAREFNLLVANGGYFAQRSRKIRLKLLAHGVKLKSNRQPIWICE